MYDANIALGFKKAAQDVMAVYKNTYRTDKMVRVVS